MQFECIDKFLDYIRKYDEDYHIYIWGVCIYGDLLGKIFNQNNIRWNGYFDNFNDVEGSCLNGKPVYKVEKLDTSVKVIYILSMRNYAAVKKQLLSESIAESNIICFDNVEILDHIEDIAVDSFVSTDRLKALNKKHDREKCFVIGNGPSLCVDDLNMIYHSGIVSLACNMIFRCYDKTLWRPDYYFFTDGVGIRRTFKDKEILKYVTENCKYMFSRSNGELRKYINEIDNLLLFKYVYSNSEEDFEFSSDCSERVIIGHTVTYVMLQMAVYMGFKEIYLLGMDHNFSVIQNKDGTVVKEDNIDDHPKILGKYMWGISDPVKTTLTYVAAKKYADNHEIKIYNATRGGKLEVFERIDINKVCLLSS